MPGHDVQLFQDELQLGPLRAGHAGTHVRQAACIVEIAPKGHVGPQLLVVQGVRLQVDLELRV